ncbi:MAG: SURF1 family protein [Alphaproteobacteria bacterium]|nr:SURF1 family protein [Alphaproteobacteria bacterium]MCB9930781.1 SURF1 family protein [Alphaproteobacteria bacterium]
MRFRRPSVLTIVFSLIAIAAMVSLGVWQLERREWKNSLLAAIAERMTQLPTAMPTAPGPDWQFRHVTVEGAVVGGQWFRFPGHSRNSQVGDLLMLLLRRPDGKLVAVEHGWVPFDAPAPPLPLVLAVEGILREPEKPGWFTPANDPAGNAWYAVDPAAMATAAGLPPADVLPLYLKPRDWQPHLPNDHLQYAITWFSLAGVFVIIFILFHRRRPGRA